MKYLDRTPFYLAAGFTAAALLAGCGGGSGAKSPVTAPFYPEPEDEWTLVWSDEFDGDSLDLANWDIQEGDGTAEGIPGWGNNELQYYTADNVSVADGMLTIQARSESVGGYNYTSARIRTYEKFDFTYGRAVLYLLLCFLSFLSLFRLSQFYFCVYFVISEKGEVGKII